MSEVIMLEMTLTAMGLGITFGLFFGIVVKIIMLSDRTNDNG